MLLYMLLIASIVFMLTIILLRSLLKIELNKNILIPVISIALAGLLLLIILPQLSFLGGLFIGIFIPLLLIILWVVFLQIKTAKAEIENKKAESISPYILSLKKYKNSDLDPNTKLLALNKISKHFFKNIFKLNYEKTFDEISELAKEEDIKKFCKIMGVIRYSGEKITSKKANSIYNQFEDIFNNYNQRLTIFPAEKPKTNKEKEEKKKEELKKEKEKLLKQPRLEEELQDIEQKLIQKQGKTLSSAKTSAIAKGNIEEKLKRLETKLKSRIDERKELISKIEESRKTQEEKTKILRETKEKPKDEGMLIKAGKGKIKTKQAEPLKTPVTKPLIKIKQPPKTKIKKRTGRSEEEKISREIKILQQRIENLVEEELNSQLYHKNI